MTTLDPTTAMRRTPAGFAGVRSGRSRIPWRLMVIGLPPSSPDQSGISSISRKSSAGRVRSVKWVCCRGTGRPSSAEIHAPARGDVGDVFVIALHQWRCLDRRHRLAPHLADSPRRLRPENPGHPGNGEDNRRRENHRVQSDDALDRPSQRQNPSLGESVEGPLRQCPKNDQHGNKRDHPPSIGQPPALNWLRTMGRKPGVFHSAQKRLTSTNMPTTRAASPSAAAKESFGAGRGSRAQFSHEVPGDQHPDHDPQSRVVETEGEGSREPVDLVTVQHPRGKEHPEGGNGDRRPRSQPPGREEDGEEEDFRHELLPRDIDPPPDVGETRRQEIVVVRPRQSEAEQVKDPRDDVEVARHVQVERVVRDEEERHVRHIVHLVRGGEQVVLDHAIEQQMRQAADQIDNPVLASRQPAPAR